MNGAVVALALTWDGARWPLSRLPKAARDFLVAAGGKPLVSAPAAVQFLARDEIDELRMCWVPCLRGGGPTLADPFTTRDGKRLRFRIGEMVPLGDYLGVRYLRLRPSPSAIKRKRTADPTNRTRGRTGPGRSA